MLYYFPVKGIKNEYGIVFSTQFCTYFPVKGIKNR